MKKIVTALALAGVLLIGCTPSGAPGTASSAASSAASDDRIQAVTSFNPIDQLVRYIGGDKVETTLFVPAGTDPHDFEPTAREMAALKESRVLFINGLGMEPWVEDGGISGQTDLMILSDGIVPIELNENGQVPEDSDHDGHDHGAHDPHVWLGLDELRIMAKNTAAALEILSPQDKDYFQENLKRFTDEADALEAEFLPQFASHAGASFVTGHEAFGYLVKNLGLVQKGVSGPWAEGEATPQKLKELVDFVNANEITTIFTEELGSNRVSETLARDTGAQVVVLPTMESKGEIFPTLRTIYEEVLASLQ